jgi:oxygen-independent coproporphyrinogen-3 oxidase
VRALLRQIETVEPAVRAMRFRTLHVGGGTPTILSEAQLDALFDRLARFRRTDDFQIGVEAHPATATPSKIEVLRAHGVARVSFGVETLTDDVLAAVHRGDQTRARVMAAVGTVRKAGLDVNLDLLAGLPGETVESFAASVRDALALEPDSLSVNRFLVENSPLGDAGHAIDPTHERSIDDMLARADAIIRDTRPPRWPDRALESPGFGTQYVWDRSSRARAYFQQDMIGAASTLGFGHGALSHLHGNFFSIGAGNVDDWVAAVERGETPPTIAAAVTPRFELAFELADRACRGRASLRDLSRMFRADVRRVLGPEIDHLVARGLLIADGDTITKPPDRSFQVTHLLAFLVSSADELRAMLRSLPTTPSPSAALRQYDEVGAELPPSLLWCRIAIRAAISARSARGRSLAVKT